VLQPLIMGRAVALHPLAVILAIAAGVVVAGIVGGLVAVPLLAVLNTAIRYLSDHPDGEPTPDRESPGTRSAEGTAPVPGETSGDAAGRADDTSGDGAGRTDDASRDAAGRADDPEPPPADSSLQPSPARADAP
jgi:AI-2E family transporter